MGKAVEDFNKDITEGNSSAELIAYTSNGFTSENFLFILRLDQVVPYGLISLSFSDLGGILVSRCPSHLRSGEAPCHGFRGQVIP